MTDLRERSLSHKRISGPTIEPGNGQREAGHPAEGVSSARPSLFASPKTPGAVTEELAHWVGEKPGRAWWMAFLFSTLLLAVGIVAMIQTMAVGIGVWGLNRTVGWGFDIVNFVYWVGIAHAGTLISSALFLFRQNWRTSIGRAAEAMTIFSIACAGIYPLIHMGRPWYFYWLMPYPNNRGTLWVNFRSPLLWDFFAIATYFTISLIFWYIGMIPDLATLRDRAKSPLARAVYGSLCHGWNGSAYVWHRYEAIYALLALLATPLVISVCSIVSFDFATSVIPGWHATIFPLYFLTGAFFCGFAMVLALLLVTRKLMRLEEYISAYHLNWMCKALLLISLVITSIYTIEAFIAWYSGDPYEMAVLADRATGPYAWAYWSMITCNVLVPQILWFRRARRTPWLMLVVCLLIVTGMWCERFVIVVPPLHRDFLPSSWAMYVPTGNEIAILIGMFGLFFSLFLLFTRVLPVVPISEVKAEAVHSHYEPQKHREHEDTKRYSNRDGQDEQDRMVNGLARGREVVASSPPHPAHPSPAARVLDPFKIIASCLRGSHSKSPLAMERLCVGYFESEHDLMGAVAESRWRGYPVLDAFTPYPVRGLAETMGLGPSRLGWIGFWAGILALALSLMLQVWVSAYDWPLRVGGQPFNSWPVWIPVSFELMVLFAGLIGVGALFARTGMWPGKQAPILRGVTDNRFAVALLETDASTDLEEMMRMLSEHGATEVVEGDELE